MLISDIKAGHHFKTRRRVGRGGTKGSYSGRGIKGQKSRAGRKMMPIVREIIKRYPKLKGYKVKRNYIYYSILNLNILDKKFETGAIVNPKSLAEKGLTRRINGRASKVKILGTGELKKKLNFENCFVSKSAKEKIEKVGGSIK
ncbi:MAG: uL15 family ribosomal protein [Candidatus Nealsonbacteria bacterium]|nr:uL15 family ribosomal protein [Candidatus Nealsonbacteria bacterium]